MGKFRGLQLLEDFFRFIDLAEVDQQVGVAPQDLSVAIGGPQSLLQGGDGLVAVAGAQFDLRQGQVHVSRRRGVV